MGGGGGGVLKKYLPLKKKKKKKEGVNKKGWGRGLSTLFYSVGGGVSA